MTDQDTAQREDTMLYRSPAPDSDKTAIQDIWGEQLEVRTVDASEVPGLLAEGWVTHPLDIGGDRPKPEEAAGFEPVKGKALEAAENLAAELTKELDAAKGEIKDLTVERDMLRDSAADTAKERDEALSNLKAAEELADAESKAKDAALARVAELEAAANTGSATLTVKKDKPS